MQVVADLAKLSLGREDYYLREIAENREEYLTGHGESSGRWYGAGAAALKQDGIASTEAFRRIFEGRHPETGELLGRAHGKTISARRAPVSSRSMISAVSRRASKLCRRRPRTAA